MAYVFGLNGGVLFVDACNATFERSNFHNNIAHLQVELPISMNRLLYVFVHVHLHRIMLDRWLFWMQANGHKFLTIATCQITKQNDAGQLVNGYSGEGGATSFKSSWIS